MSSQGRFDHDLGVLFIISSSLHANNMSLFGCPGVIPEWPLCQSYDTAYANMLPLRLNAVVETGLPVSNAESL